MGVIGIGLGTHKAQIIKDSGCWYGFPYGDMNGVSGTCIGWWDASDVGTLYQDVAGNTPVTAAGQAVHRIENKSISDDKLGNFLVVRSPGTSSALIAQYKEGGLNENSYLETQANSKGYYSSKSAGAGGVTDGSVFSNATVNNQSFTTFTVIRSGTQTGSTTLNKPAFVADGKVSGTLEEAHETLIGDTSNQKWTAKIGVDAAGNTDDIQSALTGADEFEGVLITTINSSVAAESKIRINQGYTEVVLGTVAPQANFVMADGKVSICGHCQDDTCSSMEQGFNPGTQWYEQIVFNIELSKEEIKCVEDYLMAKYNILPVMADLVGWWDFSNISTLYQDVGAFTTPITTENQTIGTVENLALGDSSGNRLGSFLRSWSTDAEFKPVFKTGGRNAKTYAQFNETSDITNQKRMLFAGGMSGSSDFTTTGGTSATNFSNLILNNQQQTVFTVWENDLNDYNDGQVMYSVYGHDAGGATSFSVARFFRNWDESNTFLVNTASNPLEWVYLPAIPHNDADHHFTTFKLDAGTNQSYVKTDFVQEATGTTSNQICDFDTNSQTGTNNGTPAVMLGGSSNSVGTYNDMSIYPWVGRIYEVLHYARTLTGAEIAAVENYLAVKYAPGPQTFITNELVGWWDFTDNESMFQTNAGATAVMANNDPIGRIMNKADGDLLGNKMGEFLSAHDNTTTYRPVFKTGGVNGLTYGEFGGGARTGLRAGFFGSPANVDGGVSATLFSDLKLNCTSQTIYAVVERTGASTSQAEILAYGGLNGAGTNVAFSGLTKASGASSGYKQIWLDIDPVVVEDLDPSDPPPSGLDIIKIVGASTASMTINGALADTEVVETDIEIDFSNATGGTTTSAAITVGNQCVNATGETGTIEWIGKIYEVFVWNKTLNGSEQAAMDTYLVNKYGQVGNIVPVSEAVGHWDFTLASSMTQTIGGTTAVASDGDRIGRVNNLAPGDANGDKLGEFLNAPSDTNVRPTYKTGGLNSHSYAKFDEGGDTSCLRGGNFDGVDSTTTGGIAADVFSNLDYNMTERTIFIMAKCDDADASTVEYLFQMWGSDDGNINVSKRESISKYINSGADANKLLYFRYDNSGNNFPNFSPSVYSDSQIDTAAKLISSRNRWDGGGLSTGDLQFWLNDNENINTWNWYTNPTYMNLQSGNNDYNRPTVSIGAYTNGDGAASLNAWDGDIYEIIVFNKALTDDEMSQMHTYFQTKYDLDFNTPTLPVISDHVGHWDFTDASSLKQLRNNTTAVTADGNPIGRVNNLAPGDASGDKLGAFMRAGADDTTRPTYKTDGIMGKSYAKFETLQGLRTGFFNSATCDDDGGETATKFSDLEFNQYSSTIFFVLNHDLESISTSGDHFMVMRGNDLTGGTGLASIQYYRSAAGDDATRAWSTSAAEGSAYVVSPDAFGSNTKLVMVKTGPGLDGMELYEDGTLKDTAGAANQLATKKIYFDENDNSGWYQAAIGTSYFQANGTINATASDDWEGDIYEILVYNKVLSADEITQVETYITSKYGISIS